MQTGCNAPSTRLSALSATAGTYRLSGFSPTTYSYSLAVIGVLNVQVSATAADSGASVSIYGGPAFPGSASRRVSSHNSFSVKVTNSGASCTYRVEMSYEAAPLTSCPAFSGQTLVNGVCVEDCPADTLIPQFDSNGEVMSCIAVGDCPFELYGTTAAEVARLGRFWFWPRWLDGPQEFSPVAAGESGTLTRRVAKCDNIWDFDPFGASPGGTPDSCIWRELNIGLSDGDCLKFSLSVEAVVPEVEDTSNRWSYRVDGCGYNESADRQASTSDPWEEDDRNCYSTDGQWVNTTGVCFTCSLQAQPTGIDTGDWTVTLGDLTEPPGSNYGNPYVDVPLEVAVTDWGDVSHLQIRVQAVAHRLGHSYDDRLFADFSIDHVTRCGGQCNFSSRTVVVPRRSGPSPSDDVIEVSISEVDDSSNTARWFYSFQAGRLIGSGSNQQFVEILRSQLLANDACPIGTDCTDPHQWPVQIVGDDARGCSVLGLVSGAALETPLGVVDCDVLDEVLDPPNPDYPPSVRYWPHLWAVGDDRFSYRTYGGDATVTIRFTDQPPSGVTPVTAVDAGHTFQEAHFPRTDSNYVCIRWQDMGFGHISCREHMWEHTHRRDNSSTVDVLYHSGVVSLPVAVDADGDYAGTRLVPSAVNADVEGRYSIRADMFSTLAAGTDFYTEIYDAATGDGSTLVSQTLGGRYCITTSFYGACTHRESLNNAKTRRLGYVQTDRLSCQASTVFWTFTNAPSGFDRYSPITGQTECTPVDVFACATDLAAHAVCWSAKRLMDQPAELTIPYIACDDRYLHFLGDQADAEAAGRTVDDYCTPSTVTVHLGEPLIETNLTASQATATEGSPLSFEVQLGEAALTDVVVDYTVTPVTATAGIDYLIPPGQVTIPAGDTTATITVFTVQDDVHELDETLVLDITTVAGASLGTLIIQATGTIVNDDPLPEVTIGDVSVDEDASVPLNPPFDIDGDGIPDTEYVYGETMTVHGDASSATSDLTRHRHLQHRDNASGTATSTRSCASSYPGNAAEDYRQGSGTLTFAPGDTSETVTVRLCPDDQSESDETLTVTLSLPSGASLDPAGAAATGTIRDNDTPVPLPFYVLPPTAPECPTLWHEHGFDCRPDHTVPIVCGTSAHAYQLHDITDPSGHRALTHPACASAPDVCSTGFHDHAGGCVRVHEDPQRPCVANRRLVWQNTIHGTSVLLACPNPDVDAELLVNTAGRSITLSFSVDVASGHVEPTRTFKITAVDGTAVNGTHYTMATPVTATFDAATHTYTMLIPTIARHDHGADPRRFTVTIIDTHPLRGHMSVTVTSAINPPAIERQ